jgi:hypothetical protein
MPFVGLTALAALVLVPSAAAKLRDPASAVAPLPRLHIPPTIGAARLLALAEVTVAAVALLVPAWPGGALLGAWYLALTGVSVLLLRSGDASCGCFGRRSAPPHPVHVVANAGLAIAGAIAAVAGSPAPLPTLFDGGIDGLIVAAEAVVGAALVVALYRDLPRVLARPRPEVAELTLAGRP